MPAIDIDYNPNLTKHKLSTLLRRDLDHRYSVYIGNRLQGNNVIVTDNDWVGASLNIKQEKHRQLTRLEVRPTVPSGAKLVVIAVSILVGALVVNLLLRSNIAPLFATSLFALAVTLAIAYFHFKSRAVMADLVDCLATCDRMEELPIC